MDFIPPPDNGGVPDAPRAQGINPPNVPTTERQSLQTPAVTLIRSAGEFFGLREKLMRDMIQHSRSKAKQLGAVRRRSIGYL
ncbi:hypothetical protein NQZ68_005965 [Dissostichus eleginoides]|nr:hypothetical protein NQZ68_005965 [Dissostichus eleginoides]